MGASSSVHFDFIKYSGSTAVVHLMLPVFVIDSQLTWESCDLAQQAWALVVSTGPCEHFPNESFEEWFYTCFHERIFDIHPSSRAMFSSGHVKGHWKAIMSFFGFAIQNAASSNDKLLKKRATELAHSHCKRGVKAIEYGVIGEVILWTFRHCLQTRFTPSFESAWIQVISHVLRMITPLAVKQEARLISTSNETSAKREHKVRNRFAVFDADCPFIYNESLDVDLQTFLANDLKHQKLDSECCKADGIVFDDSSGDILGSEVNSDQKSSDSPMTRAGDETLHIVMDEADDRSPRRRTSDHSVHSLHSCRRTISDKDYKVEEEQTQQLKSIIKDMGDISHLGQLLDLDLGDDNSRRSRSANKSSPSSPKIPENKHQHGPIASPGLHRVTNLFGVQTRRYMYKHNHLSAEDDVSTRTGVTAITLDGISGKSEGAYH